MYEIYIYIFIYFYIKKKVSDGLMKPQINVSFSLILLFQTNFYKKW